MTEDRLPLAELLAKAGDGDFLRTVAEALDAALRHLPCKSGSAGVIGRLHLPWR